MAEINDLPLIQSTVEEFLDGLDGHIYTDIEGLAAKFLEDQPWSGPAVAIAREVATSYTLATKSCEAFATWIKNVQNAARPYQMLGEEVTRLMWLEKIPQESLVLTNDTGSLRWSSVLALGEIRINCPYIVGFRNLCAHANEVFTHQPTRILLHGFYLHKDILEIWVFDRAGIYGSKAFNITKTPDLVTQILASYLLMDDASLGVSDVIKHDDRGNYMECELGSPAKACRLYIDDSPIFARVNNTIFSDGLTCYRAQLRSANDWNYAVKVKWCEPDKGSETAMLELATEKHIWGVIRLIQHRIVCGTSDWRHGLTLGNTRKLSSWTETPRQVGPGSASYYTSGPLKDEGRDSGHTPHATIGEKMLKCVVFAPLGESLHRFKSISGLMCALRDALKGHRSLYQDGGILHRDISPGNIIIPAHGMKHDLQGPKGVLIDLDLASPATASSKQFESVGTPPFQAIGVLQAYLPNNPHTYRHDLESFFYTFLFLAICKRPVMAGENQLQLPATSALQMWTQGRPVDKARAKTKDMHAESFRAIMNEFTPEFKMLFDLAEELRDLLFPMRYGKLWTGTDHTTQGTAALYSGMIDAFDKAAKIKG